MNTLPRKTLVIWHGYLLSATGSNIYTYHLVKAWVEAGHDVILVCQESDASHHPTVHKSIDLKWNENRTEQIVSRQKELRAVKHGHGECVLIKPDIDRLLPVYVIDRYAGYTVKRLIDLSSNERAAYSAAQQAALNFVTKNYSVDGVLINHATPLPEALSEVLQRANIPYAVKVHGSELEYALADDRSLIEPAQRALKASNAIIVGSDHITRRTKDFVGAEALRGRTFVVPPGVDLQHFHPLQESVESGYRDLITQLKAVAAEQTEGRAAVHHNRLESALNSEAIDAEALLAAIAAMHGTYNERQIEQSSVEQVAGLPHDTRLIAFVGKLIPQKGVHLILAALPEILEKHPNVHLVVAGFGPMRDLFQVLLQAIEAGREDVLDIIATQGSTLANDGTKELTFIADFFEQLRREQRLDNYFAKARTAKIAERVTWLGLVDHDVLARLWPLCELSLVPSVLAEAFGMVAAEAAACGCVPVVSDHSGLADAARVIEQRGVEPIRVDLNHNAGPIKGLASIINQRLDLADEERERQRKQARQNVAEAWGWPALSDEVQRLMCGE